MSVSAVKPLVLMPDQQAILDQYQGGRAAVLAAPGSGKTTLISHLIAEWVRSGKVSPRRILVLTFTESAAQEFETRTLALLPYSRRPPTFATIHGFCNRILRQLRSEYSDREVISDERKYAFLDRIVEQVGLPVSKLDYPKVLADTLIPRLRQRPYAQTFTDLEHLQAALGEADEHAEVLWHLPEILVRYDRLLARHGFIDYDQMISETHRLLQANSALVEQLRERYRWVLEDEAQDSNPLQSAILDLISGPAGNLLRVGDPNQSIFAFNGADHRSLSAFAAQYTAFPMGQSNRAAEPLMDFANRFRAQYAAAFPSAVDLRPGVANPPPGWLWVKEYADLDAEFMGIRDAVKAVMAQQQSIAILCRTNLSCQWLFEKFRALGIPARLHQERQDHFFKSDAIYRLQHVLAYLQQPNDFHRLQQLLLTLGLSRDTIRAFFNLDTVIAETLPALAQAQIYHPGVPRYEYERLCYLARELLFLVERLFYPVSHLLEWIAARLLDDAQERSQVRLLHHLWLKAQSAQAGATLDAFCAWMEKAGGRRIRQALIPAEDEDNLTAPGTVHLLTTHKAKGLEWDAVMMPFFHYDRPFSGGDQRVRAGVTALQMDVSLAAAQAQSLQEEQDEALRLVFVGITRARRFLALTRSRERAKDAGVYSDGPSPLFQALREIYRAQRVP
jgi:DNA helicase-2/ATP-dependent DNA helicase PcrA